MLIVLEGIDGSGKSTVGRALATWFRDQGRAVVETCEPWSSEPGRELRRLLSLPERTTTPTQELELFHADRAIHVRELVRPALERGEVVVQDRTFYSTAAYQGAVGLDVDDILTRSRAIAPEPDLVLFLALPPEVALERIARARESATNFEKLDNLRRVDAIYRRLAAETPAFVEIDATLPLEAVVEAAREVCAARLASDDAGHATGKSRETS